MNKSSTVDNLRMRSSSTTNQITFSKYSLPLGENVRNVILDTLIETMDSPQFPFLSSWDFLVTGQHFVSSNQLNNPQFLQKIRNPNIWIDRSKHKAPTVPIPVPYQAILKNKESMKISRFYYDSNSNGDAFTYDTMQKPITQDLLDSSVPIAPKDKHSSLQKSLTFFPLAICKPSCSRTKENILSSIKSTNEHEDTTENSPLVWSQLTFSASDMFLRSLPGNSLV